MIKVKLSEDKNVLYANNNIIPIITFFITLNKILNILSPY